MANELPPMILPSGQIVPDLMNMSRAIRRRSMSVFAKLEDDHQREHGSSMLEDWARNPLNYKDFLSFLAKVMPKEEVSSPLGPEDMIEVLDKRAAAAKIIDGEAFSPSPQPSSEPSFS